MKKLLLILLSFFIVMTAVTFSGCTVFHMPEKTPDLNFQTPTPIGISKSVFVWWSQKETDLMLLNDAWFDFRALNAGEGRKYSDDINMFTMEGNSDGTTQLEQQFLEGTAPDMIRMDHVYLASLGEKGMLLDLQKEFGATASIANRFIPSTWEASLDEQAVYGIPFDANTIIFGAQSSALQQAGVSIPTTYEELRNAGVKIQSLSLGQEAYTLPLGVTNFYDAPIFLTWLWRLGGDVLNADKTEAIFNDTETGVRALEMMLQLQKDGFLSETYEEGKAVMCDYGTWWMGGFSEEMDFALQPQLKEGVPQYSVLGVYDLAIVSKTNYPNLAYDFAVHLATGKNAFTGQHYVYTYCRNHNTIPALRAATQTAEIWDADTMDAKFWKVSVQQLELSKFREAVPCWPEIEEQLRTAIGEVISGEKTPQQALDDAADRVNRLLEQ